MAKMQILIVSFILMFCLCGEGWAETHWMVSPEGFVVGYDDLISKPEFRATGKWRTLKEAQQEDWFKAGVTPVLNRPPVKCIPRLSDDWKQEKTR